MAEIELSPYDGFAENQKFIKQARDFFSGDVMSLEYIDAFDTEKEGGNQHEAAPTTAARIKRSYYENLVKPIVRKHTAYVSQPADVDGLADKEDPLIVNIDARGTSFATFRTKSYREYFLVGQVGLLAESPNVEVETEAQRQALGIRPFAKMIEAERIFRHSEFYEGPKRGDTREIMFYLRCEKTDPTNKMIYIFRRYWFEEGASTYSVQDYYTESASWRACKDGDKLRFVEMSEVQTFYERIPARVVGVVQESSAIDGILSQQRALLNSLSVRRNILYQLGFPTRVASNLSPQDLEQFGTVSVYNWLLLRGDANLTQLDPAKPDAHSEEIRELRESIAKLGDERILQMTVSQTKQVQSAESKSMDERTKEQVYDEILDLFSQEFTHLMRFLVFFRDQSANLEQIKVEIERDYGLTDVDSDLMRLEAIAEDANDFDEETRLLIRRWVMKLKMAAVRHKTARDEITERMDQATLRVLNLTSFDYPDNEPAEGSAQTGGAD